MTKNLSKRQRASVIDAFLGMTWAIEPTWLNNAWSVLQRSNGEFVQSEEEQSALRTIAGERPEGTAYTVIPENSRTALIEIWGAIFPRANYIIYYSGGTSAELLVRDIKAAKKNPAVDEIKFIIHSPGGDVVGVTEVVDAIRDFHAAGKDTVAYVKGYAASAAFWIASTCKRVFANRTAQLGSIGVYSVYTDDTEQLKMRGLEEIEFKSTQSPDKNADPKSERGAKLIQVRMDDLCAEFIADVAANMKVSVEKVEKNFGKGDMMVARRALKAGLCHEIMTFDEAIAASAGSRTGENNFSGEEDSAEASTLNSSEKVDSKQSADTVSAQIQNDNSKTKNEEFMANEKEKEKTTAAGDQPNAGAEGVKADPAEEKPAATQQSGVTKTDAESVTSAVSATEFQKLVEQNAEMSKQLENLKAENLKKDLEATAGDFIGETAKHVSVMTALVNAHGRESDEFKSYVELQKAAASQLAESKIFDEAGKTGATAAGDETSALSQLNAKAAEIAKERKVTKQKAFVAACEENPKLYEAYQNGK